MEVKGTAVKPTMEFVKNKFPEKYDEWFNSLPEKSKSILSSHVNATFWYPAKDAYLIPTQSVCEMFYDDIFNAAFKLGEYSAENSLKGVYKVFIRITTPKFLLSRGLNMFSSYFKPSNVKLEIKNKSLFHFYIYQFSKEDEIIMHRISGWMSKALDLINRKNIIMKVEQFKENSETVFKIICSWD